MKPSVTGLYPAPQIAQKPQARSWHELHKWLERLRHLGSTLGFKADQRWVYSCGASRSRA